MKLPASRHYFFIIVAWSSTFSIQAAPILEIALLIDGSGSISSSDFDLQKSSYGTVLNSEISTDGSVAVGVWQFASTVQQEFATTVIDSDEDKTALISALNNMTQIGSGTLIGLGIDTASADLLGNDISSDTQIINVSTDGIGSDDPQTSANNAVTAGIEQVNCLGVGPNARCDFTAGTGALAVTAPTFADFESALSQQIGQQTNTSSTPLTNVATTTDQRSVAGAFETACSDNNSAQPPDSALQSTCTDIFALTGNELTTTLKQLSPRQVSQQSNNVAQLSAVQTRNLRHRLNSIRAGVRGVSLSGLETTINGENLPIGDIVDAETGLTGGSAGEHYFSSQRLGVFITGSIITGDKDAQSDIDGYDFDTHSITVGSDYRLTDDVIVGVALGISDSESDTDTTKSEFNGDSLSLSTYGNWYPVNNTYVDWILTYGDNEYDSRRQIAIGSQTENSSSNTDGDQWSMSASVGYEYPIKQYLVSGFFQVGYMEATIDSYNESGSTLSLAVGEQVVRSLPISVGARVDRPFSTQYGVLIPQIEIELVNELKDDPRTINSHFIQSPNNNSFSVQTVEEDSNYLNLSFSLNGTFKGGQQGFIRFATELARDDTTAHTLEAGYRVEF